MTNIKFFQLLTKFMSISKFKSGIGLFDFDRDFVEFKLSFGMDAI